MPWQFRCVLLSQRRYTQAVEFYEQALTFARINGDRRGEGKHMGNLGWPTPI